MTNLAPLKVLVAGGGTLAPIDDVRLITNISSGRFAAAITETWLDRGALVWHVHAPCAQVPLWRFARLALDAADPAAELARLAALREKWERQRDRLKLLPLETGTVADYAAVLERALRASEPDVVMLPMAVSDFELDPRPGKINSESDSLTLVLRPTPKVIRLVRDWAPSAFLVGFKLLSRVTPDELIRRAERAGREQRADLTVANDLETLRAGRHTIHLVRPGCPPETLEPGPDLADRLVARVALLAGERLGRRALHHQPSQTE
jgi:phosphopantothenate---cysteine ligase (CTP)